MDSFLSQDYVGLLIALSLLTAGVLLGLWGRKRRPRLAIPAVGLAAIAVPLALAMTFGAARHVVEVAAADHRHPPPGRMIDVGGYRLHLWCEGPRTAGPPVVWIPGLRDEGARFVHLQRRLRRDLRTCLLDRSGVGWSDIGTFPKSIDSEVSEIALALVRSGEQGPFIIAGHSLGGLLAENIAVRRRDLVAGLILMDATPPDSWIYGRKTMCIPLKKLGRAVSFITQFGLWDWAWSDVYARQNPLEKAALIDVQAIIRDHDDRARNGRAMASQVSAECDQPLALVRYRGALGSMPITVIIPSEDFASFKKLSRAGFPQLDDIRFRNMFEIQEAGRRARGELSSQTKVLYAPDNAGHNFPYTQADFVEAQVRALAARIASGGAPAPP